MHEETPKSRLKRLKRLIQRFSLLTTEEVNSGDVYYLVYTDVLENDVPKLFAACHAIKIGLKLTLHPKDTELFIFLPRFAAIKHYYLGGGILQFSFVPKELELDLIELLKRIYLLNHPNINRIIILP